MAQVRLEDYSAGRNLSTRCISLIERAACIDALRESCIDPALAWFASQSPPRTIAQDAVQIVWALLRQGGLLCGLLNQRRSDLLANWTRLPAAGELSAASFTSASSRANTAAYLAACRDELYMAPDELFDAERLYAEDTAVFERALALAEDGVRSIARIRGLRLDELVAARRETNALYARAPNTPGAPNAAPKTPNAAPNGDSVRLKVLSEIRESERTYVADLGRLERAADELARAGLSAATRTAVFANLSSLAAAQRRFLARLEAVITDASLASVSASYRADVANLFSGPDGLGGAVAAEHAVFCANHAAAAEALEGAVPAAGALADAATGLRSLLIRPIQRVCRYQLLLRDLVRRSPPEAPDRAALLGAQAVAEEVARRVNEAARRAENDRERAALLARVTDWRGLEPASFGPLLLHAETARFVAGGTPSRPHPTYLFAHVLVMRSGPRESAGPRGPLVRMRDARREWELKGHVFTAAMTDVRLGGLGSVGAHTSVDLGEDILGTEAPATDADAADRDVHIQYTAGGRDATYTLRFPTTAVARMWVRVLSQRLADIARASAATRHDNAFGLSSETAPVVTVPVARGGPSAAMSAAAAASPHAGQPMGLSFSPPSVRSGGVDERHDTLRAKIRLAGETHVAMNAAPGDTLTLGALRAAVGRRLRAASLLLPGASPLGEGDALAYVDAEGDAVALIDDADLGAALAERPGKLVLCVLRASPEAQRASPVLYTGAAEKTPSGRVLSSVDASGMRGPSSGDASGMRGPSSGDVNAPSGNRASSVDVNVPSGNRASSAHTSAANSVHSSPRTARPNAIAPV